MNDGRMVLLEYVGRHQSKFFPPRLSLRSGEPKQLPYAEALMYATAYNQNRPKDDPLLVIRELGPTPEELAKQARKAAAAATRAAKKAAKPAQQTPDTSPAEPAKGEDA